MYLNFSDAAKFADVARNIVNGLGYGSEFSFWPGNIANFLNTKLFSAINISPVMPYSIAAFFKIFGVNDFAVIATSFFYFILTLVFTFLLARKIWKSNLVGVLSTLAVGFNYDLINYATSGASESPFIFEIVAGAYFISLKKKWANIVATIFLILLYFTRPLGFIYIAGLSFYFLLINFKLKNALAYFVLVLIAGFLVDHFILLPLSGRYFLYSIIGRGIGSSFNQSGVASDALRGAVSSGGGIAQTLKNIFYNLYNFYKLLPQIMSPYLFALFAVGLFVRSKDNTEKSFKLSTLFMLLTTLIVTAASIPFFRYIHPVVPLVYILATGTLMEIINKFQITSSKQITIFKLQVTKQTLLVLGSCLLVLFFGVGQTVGVLILDSRFQASTHNVGEPPVYVRLAEILKTNTLPNQVVITNLDTWGSWYGDRKTIWFPLEPKQIIDPSTGKIPFDAIYLTSYLIDDPNYYMGSDWRDIFNNPKDPTKWTCDGCFEISEEFSLKGVYSVSAGSDYERQDAKAILLIHK